MNWKKHILVAAIVLNCVLYLGTAIGVAVNNTRQSKEALSHYATLPHQTLDIELSRLGRLVRDMLTAHHSGELSMTEKIHPPTSPLLKIVDVSKVISGKLEHLPSFHHPVSIPMILIENGNSFHFMHFDKAKKLYISVLTDSIDYLDDKKNSQLTPYKYVITYEIQADKWLQSVSALETVHMSIVEYDANFKPLVLFTNLKPEENDQLLQQSPLHSNSDYVRASENHLRRESNKSVFRTTLAGTKNIVYPYILSTHPDIQQVVYYILPLPDFDSISVESVFILILSFLTTLTAAIVVGMYSIKTTDQR